MKRGILFILFGLGLISVGTKHILDERKEKPKTLVKENAEEVIDVQ